MRLIFFSLILLLSGSLLRISAQNSWIQKMDVGGMGRIGAIGFNIADKGYIGLGTDSITAKTDFWQYDPSTDTWSQMAEFPGGTRVNAAAFSVGGKGYVCVGRGNSGNNGYANKEFWSYDPVENAWTQKAFFPGHVRDGAIGLSIGTKGYIGLGGYSAFGISYYKDLWEYDPSTDTWTKKSDFVNPRVGAVSFSIGNKGYAGTGFSSFEGVLKNDFWQYDPNTNSWIKKAEIPSASREEAVAFSIGGKGYVGTGLNDSLQLIKDFWEYDTATNAWSQRADFAGGVRRYAVGFSIGNRGYIGTGSNAFSEDGSIAGYQKDFWEYTPSSACTAPSDLTTTSITATSAQLNWNKVADATRYKLKIRRDSSGAPWYGIFINPPDTFFSVSNLQPGGKYAWKVKSICNSGKSDFSPTIKFTTPMRLGTDESNFPVAKVYPNPFASSAVISLTIETAGAASIILYNLDGVKVQTLLEKDLQAGAYQIPLDRKNLAAGIYLLRLKLDSETSVMKVVIE